jgi:cell division protein FtsW
MADKVLFSLTVMAISIGVLFSYSLSTYIVVHNDNSQFHFFMRQFSTAIACIFLMGIISKMNPDRAVARLGWGLLIIFTVMMAIMPILPSSLVPLINGAKRWVRLGPINISPVEFFKIGFVYFLAWSFTRKFYHNQEHRSLIEELKIFAPYILVLGMMAFMVVYLQNDLGQAIVMSVTLATMMLFAGSSFRLFLSLISLAFITGVIFIIFSSYRLGKVLQWWASIQDNFLSHLPPILAEFLRVEKDRIEEGYQAAQSINAIHNGGISGTNIGEGIYKLGFVSDIHTDFILAGIIEESGFIGAVLVSAVILSIVYRIFKIANRSENPIYYLFCVGIATMTAIQFLINSLGISGIMPIKGITVPFVSYGGSSLISMSIAIGMVIMISKRSRI